VDCFRQKLDTSLRQGLGRREDTTLEGNQNEDAGEERTAPGLSWRSKPGAGGGAIVLLGRNKLISRIDESGDPFAIPLA